MSARAIIGALLVTGFVFALSATASAAVIELQVTGLRSNDGAVLVAVFDREEIFLNSGEQILTISLDAEDAAAGTVSGVVEGLPAGEYALVVHHDENGNDRFDTNFLGLPDEGYGFSNDVEAFLSRPAFEDAAFELAGNDISLAVRMTY